MSVARTAGFALASAAIVAGHGYVSGIVADGQYYGGYLVDNYPYNPSPPDTIGWSTTATDLGFVDATGYNSGDIACHRDAQPGAIHATVAAGAEIEFQWNTWPQSHHGPVIEYLANCNGDCSTVDKESLEWFKISEAGLIDGSAAPGNWASDELIANNNSWTVTLPSSIAAGNYVLRHEIIALHSAGQENGAQNYPQCFNLEITGGGSDTPAGVVASELYTADEEGILFNIYTPLDSYPIPGPALWTGGSGSGGGSGSAPTSSAPAPTSSVVPTSAPTATPTATTTTPPVTVTTTPPAETQVVVPTETSTEAPAPTATSTPEEPEESEEPSTPIPDSDSLAAYFDSLSASELVNHLKETFSWLVADKVHARSLQ
ncbi:glycosyl hydrolase family 61-domain-containing protein [Aspergillus karnatakaensis]|uniref:lytic polysaccharide monooxygenase auxiliary activity family 9 protein n=1 Tax=Aspergillus karnatakaensis TaxID=1810916 RepID=UPI003CCCF9E2